MALTTNKNFKNKNSGFIYVKIKLVTSKVEINYYAVHNF